MAHGPAQSPRLGKFIQTPMELVACSLIFSQTCEEKGAWLVCTPRKQGGDCSLLLSIAVVVPGWSKERLDPGFKAIGKLDRVQQGKPQACRERLGRAEGAGLV